MDYSLRFFFKFRLKISFLYINNSSLVVLTEKRFVSQRQIHKNTSYSVRREVIHTFSVHTLIVLAFSIAEISVNLLH